MEEQNMGESSMPKPEEEGKGGQVKKLVGLAVVIVVIALGVYVLTRGNNKGNQNQITPEAASTQNNEAAAPAPIEGTTTPETSVAPAGETVTVTFIDTGFSSPSVTIKKGDSVTFTNASPAETWPASALHPTHTVYPGSGIEKCGTDQAAGIFDACRGLKNGESWSFQFNEVGKWNYHDHLSPTKFGSVTVTE